MSVRRVVQIAASVPWSRKSQKIVQDGEQDGARRPLLRLSSPPQANFSLYGTTDRMTSSPEGHRRERPLGRVPEEEQVLEEAGEDEDEITADEVEWALEEQGLYGGSYRRKVALYTFVPLSSLLVFIGLALLPTLFWSPEGSEPPQHPPYFPFPILELLVSISLWSTTHLVRLPIYSSVSWLFPRFPPFVIASIFSLVHALLSNFLRISALPIMRVRHQMDYVFPFWRDFAFQRVWWLGLGYAAFEAITGIAQDYAQISLYKNVMIPEENIAEVVNQENTSRDSSRRGFGSSQEEIHPLSPRADAPSSTNAVLSRVGSNTSFDPSRSGPSRDFGEELELEVDRDIEQLVKLKEREEVEEVYGVPVIRIPVFVLCLQRIDSIIVTLGISLILSACYLRSNISLSTSSFVPVLTSNRPIAIAFPLVCLLNLFLAILYTPAVLPKVGVHTSAYIGFLVGLSVLFTGLGLWGALS